MLILLISGFMLTTSTFTVRRKFLKNENAITYAEWVCVWMITHIIFEIFPDIWIIDTLNKIS